MPSFDRLIPQELASQFVTLKMPTLGGTPSAAPHANRHVAPPKNKPGDPLQIAYQRGYSAGYAQAEQDLQALLNARATQLAPMISSVQEQISALNEQQAQRILELSITLAEQIVRAEVKTHTAPLIEVIREALNLIAESVARISVHVHPSDAPAVRDELSREEPRMMVVEDPSIAPGGCRVVTAQGDIDATLKRRIDAARLALGLPALTDPESLETALAGNPLV